MRAIVILVVIAVIVVAIWMIVRSIRTAADKEATKILDKVVSRIEPVLKEVNETYWNATNTGEKKWYDEYKAKEIEYRKILSDKEIFKKLKELKDKKFENPLVERQVIILYLDALENQLPEGLRKELVSRGAELEEKFNTFRATVDENIVTDNEIREKMRKSLDIAERKKLWEASKQVGAEVADNLIQLVKKRNEAAGLLGFKNYYDLELAGQELTEKELYSILSQLNEFTQMPFEGLKSEIDNALAARHGISVDELRPWHYEDVFFQEAPQIYDVNLDQYFKGRDIIKLVAKYYGGMGLAVDDIIARSDLFEKKGKEQHAYCTDIDRKGDVRILANVKDSEYWAGTMLHELGHAVYDKYRSPDMPFLLREPAHIFTTEAIAELFGRLVYYPQWLSAALGPENGDKFGQLNDKLNDTLRAQMLVFARWVLVMANFEKALYENPGQDLNGLWWNMVEKYQMVRRPEGRDRPDWAAKIHFSTAPVYYHNYILGEILASQITDYLNKNVSNGGFVFVDNKKLGPYLKEKIFGPGSSLKWDDLVENATNEPLNPKYFAKQFAE